MEKLYFKAVWLFFWHFFFAGFFIAFFILAFAYPMIMAMAVKAEFNPAFSLLFSSFVVLVIYLVSCYVLARLSYRFWGYELTENVIKIEKGIIFKKYISIPYDRIQNVDIYRGFLARILGLSDLQIQTAGYSGGTSGILGGVMSSEGRLPGLHPQVAEQLREELTQKVKFTKQGI